MNRYATSSAMREMQFKTAMRYYHTPTNMAKIKKTVTCFQGCGEAGSLMHCWWQCKMLPSLWMSLSAPQNIKYRDAAIPLLSI